MLETIILDLLKQIIIWLPRAGSSILLLILFWILANITKSLILKIFSKVDNTRQIIIKTLAKISKTIIIIFGLITALGSIGIDITALVTGLGLSGFALSFAMKDTLSNILAGILIIIYRPFTINDNIAVAGSNGKVLSIDLRYTCLQSEDKKILIPNANLLTKIVSISN